MEETSDVWLHLTGTPVSPCICCLCGNGYPVPSLKLFLISLLAIRLSCFHLLCVTGLAGRVTRCPVSTGYCPRPRPWGAQGDVRVAFSGSKFGQNQAAVSRGTRKTGWKQQLFRGINQSKGQWRKPGRLSVGAGADRSGRACSSLRKGHGHKNGPSRGAVSKGLTVRPHRSGQSGCLPWP